MQVTTDDIVPVLALHHGRRTGTVVHAFVPGSGITYAPVGSPDTPLGWAELVPKMPGTPVVAVPARDVLVITGSDSPAGVDKAHRCVERVLYARPHNSLLPDLLERRGNRWYVFDDSPPPVGEEFDGTWSPPEDRTIVPRPYR